MLIEISLIFIAATMLILTVFMAVAFYQSRKIVQITQKDLHNVLQEITRTLNTINTFIHSDLHPVTQKTYQVITEAANICSDVKNKINSVNFLFSHLHTTSSRLSSETPSEDPNSHYCEIIPQILKWIVSSTFLIKTAKNFVKHERQK